MIEGLFGATNQNTVVGKGKSTLGKDDFMQLMVTQLKYQDPMNPTQGAEFASQLAQFSSLEQLSNMNTTLENSMNANYALTQSVNNTLTAALIGKEVKIGGADFSYSGEENITLGYKLPAEASSMTIKIFDKNDKLIKTIENPEKTSGEHKLLWDFTDNDGNKVPLGEYKFKMEAKSLTNEEMTFNSYKIGLISGIRFTDNGTKLVIGKSEYDMSSILEILNPISGGN